ncbi:MAG TPA: hypothetical protein VKL19_05115 [Thermoanaerobaculia bacterium]|nr:hypothetical protein [Thermoanaerobaculia bacterium]
MTSIPIVPETRRHRIFGGLSERQEHIFTWIGVVVVLFYVAGWVGAIREAVDQQRELAREAKEANVKVPLPPPPAPTQQITSALTEPTAPTAAFINDAMLTFLSPLRGASGKVEFATRTPNTPIVSGAPNNAKSVLVGGSGAQVQSDFVAPAQPGIYKLAVQLDQATRQIQNFNLITLVPFSQKQNGRIGLYYLGSWPFERGGTPKTPNYANPSGFIEVTPQNADTPVSEHFRLRDFITKDQPNVWPKYLLLNPKLLDKLELTIQELQAMGHPVRHLTIMSGFRTPNYNVHGGDIQGRANLSRHMYGDASDVFVDNDGNVMMDDLNGDRRVDVRDAEVIQQAVERVERKYPSLVGGVGVYSACCGHGPFTHIDVRGYRARWRGTGNG